MSNVEQLNAQQDTPREASQPGADAMDVFESHDGSVAELAESSGTNTSPSTKRFSWQKWFRKKSVAADPASVAAGDDDGVVEAASAGQPETKSRMRFSVPEKRKFSAVPIRILIGFLPEVTERDARDYALGVAEKHFEQPAIAHFDAFKYGEGYAYEVHEGGDGHGYLPEVIRYFESQGPYRPGENIHVVIRTGTRMVEVQRQKKGLTAILLPEGSTHEPTAWLEPAEKLSPALNQRTAFLVAGAAFFVAGFFALIVGSMLTRYQSYDAAPEAGTYAVSYENLPISQWSKLQNLAPNSFVAKLSFENKKWQQPVIQVAAPTPQPSAQLGMSLPGMPSTPVIPPAPADMSAMNNNTTQ